MKLFVYCAGGFGKEIYDTAKRANQARPQWDAIYFIDDTMESGSTYYGTTVYTLDGVLAGFDLNEIEVVIANGEPLYRKKIYEKIHAHGIRLGRVIDPSAVISDTATLAPGVVVTPFCLVASDAVVGLNVALNARAIIGHDIRLGAHGVASSMANVGGACVVGDGFYIGMGALIKEKLTIGSEVIIGMGSVVHNDIPDAMIALGNPARPMRPNVDKIVFKKN
ncbi:sugar acetyltransferase [Pseudoduganella sp. FT93W]|uniref:Sugar acetyltransferase n=1 Tax=Duganella fentianensis TaxID=2692177 RepID=A0A845I1U7_9BURK|nr:NeuD/PglB/VioB family sugar acetyltransferase [Duganella fentianensis]MYN46067.1 sugar acetyltransferase [Duganella fentianensis]